MSQSAATRSNPSVLQMALPLVVSFWMRAAFTFVDTIYAALLGDPAQAAIGLTIPFEFLMIAIWVGLSTGLTSNLSRAMGARAGERIQQYQQVTWGLVRAAVPVFLLIAAGIWLVAERVGLDPEVARNFRIYGTVLIGGSACVAFWSVVPDSVVKAHQDTRSTMWAGIISNLINVILNTVFLFVLEWGIFGIAFSTVLGRIGGLAYALLRARAHEQAREATGRDTVPGTDPHPVRALFTLAIPASITFALMAGEGTLVNTMLASLENSTAAIAAYSIFYRILMFAMNPVIAFGVAMLPYAARRLGSQDIDGVWKGFRQATALTAGYCIFIAGPALVFGASPLAGALAESPLTATYAESIVRLVPLVCLVSIPFLLCRPVFEGMGKGRPGLWMATLRYVVLTAPAAWAGMHLAAAQGVAPVFGLVLGLVVAGAIVSGVFYTWLRRAIADWRPPQVEETLARAPESGEESGGMRTAAGGGSR